MANTLWRNDSTDGTIRVSLPADSGHVLVVASDGELFVVLPVHRPDLVDLDGCEILDRVDDAFERVYEQRRSTQ